MYELRACISNHTTHVSDYMYINQSDWYPELKDVQNIVDTCTDLYQSMSNVDPANILFCGLIQIKLTFVSCKGKFIYSEHAHRIRKPKIKFEN